LSEGDKEAAREHALTFARVKELSLTPIRGNFDEAHLRAVHRHIFQDTPHHKPGEFRDPARGHFKHRGLETRLQGHVVPYASREQVDRELGHFLDELGGAKALAGKDTLDTAEVLAEAYAKLDYLHPFAEGNSRTLRTFTAQLASESGHELDWNTSNAGPQTRDALYIARDIAVIEQHFPGITAQEAMTTEDRERYAAALMLGTHAEADRLPELLRISLERGKDQEPYTKSMTPKEIEREVAFIGQTAINQAHRHAEGARLAELRGKGTKEDHANAHRASELAEKHADPEKLKERLAQVLTDQIGVRFVPGAPALQRLAAITMGVDRELERGKQSVERQNGNPDHQQGGTGMQPDEHER
jgi:cell filamentation protein